LEATLNVAWHSPDGLERDYHVGDREGDGVVRCVLDGQWFCLLCFVRAVVSLL
jgi:hypothetical protein